MKDVNDWLAGGHTAEELVALATATPACMPEAESVRAQATLPSRVTLRRAADVVATPVTWLVHEVVPAGMLTVLHARDKLGKTLLGWEIARAVLRQEPLLGEFSTAPGRVILALLDDPAAITVERRDTLALTDCDDLRLITPMDADLSEPERFVQDFAAACRGFRPAFIVIDALYLFIPTSQNAGNDTARMRPVMQAFNALAEQLGAAVVVIAHDTKDGQDVAGSHVIRAAAKALLHLSRPKWSNDEEEDDGRRVLTVVSKLTAEARFLVRCQGCGKWDYLGRGDSAQQARSAWARDRVAHYLKAGGAGTKDEVSRELRMRKEDVLTALTTLEEEGLAASDLVSRADGRKGKGRRVYRRNDSSKETNGNDRSESREPASDNASSDRPNVPLSKINGGTIGLPEKSAPGAGNTCATAGDKANVPEIPSLKDSAWDRERF